MRGWATAAAAATTPKRNERRAAPLWKRRAARIPAPAAIATAAATTMRFSASLSFVPKAATMTSLAPGGWRLITRAPIATTSEGAPSEPGDELGGRDRHSAGQRARESGGPARRRRADVGGGHSRTVAAGT